MCSCFSGCAKYDNQEKIGTNYNNITNRCRFWLTTDSICYLNNSLFQRYILVNKNNKRIIGFSAGYGLGEIQRYGDKIYILDQVASKDERNSKFSLKRYDVKSKSTKKICSINNCDMFLVLNGSIYYSEYRWLNDDRILSLKRFSIDSEKHTTICGKIISFGVSENCLYYVIEENGVVTILTYDAENDQSVKRGEFSADALEGQSSDYITVSYMQTDIFFSWNDYENGKATVLKYSFDQNALTKTAFDGYIDGFVSYDANSFFILYSEKSDSSELFKLNNDTSEIAIIAKFKGSGSMFVGSDTGAYVLKCDDNVIRYYSVDGNSRVVYRF
jgi:hypothetical protein